MVRVKCPNCETIFFVERDALNYGSSIFIRRFVHCPHCVSQIFEDYINKQN
jgi:uncharacterized C2H2 Zn-finger protein